MHLSFQFFFNSILLGIGLAMDAFSVSLANGLNEPTMPKGKMVKVAGVFSGFQFLMPVHHNGKLNKIVKVTGDREVGAAVYHLFSAGGIHGGIKRIDDHLESPLTVLS